jgi:hypothetical protein
MFVLRFCRYMGASAMLGEFLYVDNVVFGQV